ncbi:MAG: glycosyltransferase family 4 protein [Chlorobi bacterium]|nr:glycosyltransferase family 4 protein [Chlorobiota bacterium]
MKILILTNKLPYPPKDGGSIATLNLSIELAKQGNTVHLLSLNTTKHYFPVNEIPAQITNLVKFYDVYTNTKIKFFKAFTNLLFSNKPYNAIRFKSKEYKNKLIQLIRYNNYDIVQLEGLYMSFYVPAIRKHSNAFIAMRSHNVEHEIWRKNASFETNKIKKIYLKILAKRIKQLETKTLNHFDALLPITENDAKRFKLHGCIIPIHITPVGINYTSYQIVQKPIEFPTLFHIGALDWIPNLEGLTWFFKTVWPELHAAFPKLKFYLAGRNAASDFEKTLNIKGVEYIGEIEDAKAFIQSKAIMVVPLFAGSGMRIKIIEGLAMHKAIVSTRLGVEGIPVTDKKNICLADNKEEFISKISMLIKDDNLFNMISKEAGIFVQKNFDTFTITNNLISFYYSLLQ